MSSQTGGVPVLIMREGSGSRGKDVQRNNIMAAKTIAEAVKSSLGPKGMDKMLVDSSGDVIITSDGRTILDKMDIGHPAAKMMVEVAKTQDAEVGDGTTTSVIVAGELLGKAEDLINKGIHPILIVEGYSKAADKALETLEKIAFSVNPTEKEFLMKVAATSMASKLVADEQRTACRHSRQSCFACRPKSRRRLHSRLRRYHGGEEARRIRCRNHTYRRVSS